MKEFLSDIQNLPQIILSVFTIGLLGLLIRMFKTSYTVSKQHKDYLQDQIAGLKEKLSESQNELERLKGKPFRLNTNITKVKPKLFISTPVRVFFNGNEYKSFVGDVNTMIIKELRDSDCFGEIFYESETLSTRQKFEHYRLKPSEYFRRLDKTDIFVAIIPVGSITGVYFEAGYALARGKTSVYFVGKANKADDKIIPGLMDEARLLPGFQITKLEYESLVQVKDSLISLFSY